MRECLCILTHYVESWCVLFVRIKCLSIEVSYHRALAATASHVVDPHNDSDDDVCRRIILRLHARVGCGHAWHTLLPPEERSRFKQGDQSSSRQHTSFQQGEQHR